jgi:protein TonB
MIILLSVLTASSQKINTYYITGNGERTSKSFARYKRTVDNQNNRWFVRDYYLNDSLQMTGCYLDKKLSQKTDTFNYYYLNGKISKTVIYRNNLKNDTEKSYHITGKLSKVTNYNNGEIFGKWFWYDEDGNLVTELDSVNKEILSKYYSPPLYVGGQSKLKEYLGTMKYPEEDQYSGAYGQTITTFQIDEAGNVSEVDIIVHGTEKMDSAIIKHLYKMPKWAPAKQNGEYVTSYFILPMQFTLEFIEKVSLSDEIIAKGFFISGLQDFKAENYEKALLKFKKAIDYSNMEAKYYYFTGHCYYKLKKQDFACEYWFIANLLDSEILKEDIKKLCKLK